MDSPTAWQLSAPMLDLSFFTDLLLLIIIRGSKQSTNIEGMYNIPRIYIYTASLMEVST